MCLRLHVLFLQKDDIMATNSKPANSGKPVAKANQNSQQAPTKRKCPWCDTLVDINTPFCPECGEKLIKGAKKQPKKKKKHPVLLGILFVFLSFFILVTIAGIGSSSGRSKSSKSNKSYSAETSSNNSSNNTTSTGDSDIPMGQKWIVDGQWELMINSVTESSERNEYSEKRPSAVYIIDYNYTNLGYYDSVFDEEGLFFSLDGLDDSVVDNGGQLGYSYPISVAYYPQQTPIGASCHAQVAVGVDNPGNMKIKISKHDGNGNKQSATMSADVK